MTEQNPLDVTQTVSDVSRKYAEEQLKLEKANIERRRQGKCFCMKCGDTGFVPVLRFSNFTKEHFVALKKCGCQNAAEVKRAMEVSGLAREIENKTFASFKTNTPFQQQIKDTAIKYLNTLAENKRYWFYIGGQSGCGKSHICTAIANRFLQKGYQLFYMRWVDELRTMKTNLSDTGRLNALKKCEVLYIDDLFKTRPTEYELSVAFEILNYRDNNNLITILSSEYTPAELKSIDEATYGRVKINTNHSFMIGVDKDISKNFRI